MTYELQKVQVEQPEVPDMQHVKLGEMTVDKLYSPAGVNPDTGSPTTLLDELRAQETDGYGGRLYTQIGDYLSDGAKATNKLLHDRRAQAGAFMIAVIAIRAVWKKHT